MFQAGIRREHDHSKPRRGKEQLLQADRQRPEVELRRQRDEPGAKSRQRGPGDQEEQPETVDDAEGRKNLSGQH